MEILEIPQWKKDLIARLRNQNKRSAVHQQQLVSPAPHSSAPLGHAVQQPNLTYTEPHSVESEKPCAIVSVKCNVVRSANNENHSKMVQERVWIEHKMVRDNGYRKDSDSDSSEELSYGPGIVSKLKNKYLSLALRESNVRPSILPMRKAASLENLLEDEPSEKIERRKFTGKNAAKNLPNRYHRSTTKFSELKRTRSVEVISTNTDIETEKQTKRESMHEDMLITNGKEKEGNDKPYRKMQQDKAEAENNQFSNNRINRPKRIAPMMNEREKPPADVVKQAKLIFERRADRSKAPPLTGEVAAKIDAFNSIIGKTKTTKKLPIKFINDKTKTKKVDDSNCRTSPPKSLDFNSVMKNSTLPSPIPDISRIDYPSKNESEGKPKRTNSLSETPDLILTSSPLPASPTFKKTATENFIKHEILNSNSSKLKPCVLRYDEDELDESPILAPVKLQPEPLAVNKNVLHTKTPTSQPLQIEVNGVASKKCNNAAAGKSLEKISPKDDEKHLRENLLTSTEIEKNLINTVKSLQENGTSNKIAPLASAKSISVEVNNKVVVPRKQRAQEPVCSTTEVFNFTTRRDVPDYISNDTSRSPGRPELPKPGEGGIILIPGASISESFTDEEDEILRSLEAPPSPCDVSFINDNILIDGKSSLNLSQKSKRSKMKISFVEAGPEVFEYPSETSLLLVDDSPSSTSPNSNAQVGQAVPNLAGSSLANYTPKSTEDFQPGITRSIIQNVSTTKFDSNVDENEIFEEKPIAFSAGTNADILF